MEMIRQVVKEKRQAIVLIPEIALTYQTVMRFYRTFGGRVSIMNSRLSAGERYDQMMRAKKGEIEYSEYSNMSDDELGRQIKDNLRR